MIGAPKRTTPNRAGKELGGNSACTSGTAFDYHTAVAARACPKCSSDRTRGVGPAASSYLRCDACEYLFCSTEAIRSEPPEHPADARQFPCPICGSHRTRIVGQSGNPPVVHRECQTCGHLFSRPLDG
jgi:hypothetical protein